MLPHDHWPKGSLGKGDTINDDDAVMMELVDMSDLKSGSFGSESSSLSDCKTHKVFTICPGKLGWQNVRSV